MTEDKKIKVLIIDDSALVRKVLAESLSRDKELEVVGTAADPYIARDKILSLRPDVITLDIQMPRMDGLTFLKKLQDHYPLPAVIVAAGSDTLQQQTLDAVRNGTVDIVDKPGTAADLGEMEVVLADKLKAVVAASRAAGRKPPLTLHHPLPTVPRTATAGKERRGGSGGGNKLVVIGASTGGTRALESVLLGLPAECPPVVIVQHMPEPFTQAFAMRLNDLCAMEVKEAENGDEVVPGRVIIARGNYHMVVRRNERGHYVEVRPGPLVSRHRPSVNVLFKSAAEWVPGNVVGVILTGMGDDGAAGMKMLHDAGAATIAEAEESCVVFGMPKEAIAQGGVDYVVPLEEIPGKIMALT